MNDEVIYALTAAFLIFIATMFYKKYIDRPRLDVRIGFPRMSYKKLSVDFLLAMQKVDENTYKVPEKGDAYEIIYEYDITITNNSNVSAHYLKFYYKEGNKNFSFIDKYNQEHVGASSYITIQGQVHLWFVVIVEEKDWVKYAGINKEHQFLVEYRNSQGGKFYTLFIDDKSHFGNLYRYFKPKGYLPHNMFTD